MRTQIVDPSLGPADPEATCPLRERVGVVLFVVGFAIILIGEFWLVIPQWFFIVGSMLLITGVSFFGRGFGDEEADHDIRKLYGTH